MSAEATSSEDYGREGITHPTGSRGEKDRDTPLAHIWTRIRDELAYLQDLASEEHPGEVINPIYGAVFSRDTAFAAQVFATEFRRTQEERWKERASAALGALNRIDIYRGVDEPVWNRYGWHLKRGSLATTGMLLDAVWEAQRLLDMERKTPGDWLALSSYLASCRVAPGLFAHDAVQPRTSPPAVHNTTAIALYLVEYMALKMDDSSRSVFRERQQAYVALQRGQRPDGFWPYIFPGAAQQIYFRLPSTARLFLRELPFLGRMLHRDGDRSIFFGDIVHHCLVVYYLAKSLSLSGKIGPLRETLKRGWKWITAQMRETPEEGFRLDFASEPVPKGPRYCNFRETTSYFLILASLPLLSSLGVINQDDRAIAEEILIHIQNHLLEKEGTIPAIKPYEGPVEVLRYILPRVGESVAWKGGCLSSLVLDRCKLSATLLR
ncbi:MAG: hypothetical protein QHH30_07185 [candidate division NC10 bacterium]|nr:hypothetical protein [candidate division NC10 bacterium]